MTLKEFNLLDNNDKKADAVWSSGVHVATRKSPWISGVKILLYQLPKFYVEVHYDSENNKVIRLLSFKSIEYLEPYLLNIDIQAML
jgi:hypothetical protein